MNGRSGTKICRNDGVQRSDSDRVHRPGAAQTTAGRHKPSIGAGAVAAPVPTQNRPSGLPGTGPMDNFGGACPAAFRGRPGAAPSVGRGTTRLKDAAGSLRVMRAIQAQWSSLAVDDFGTGSSSPTRLYRVPISSLTVGRCLNRDAPTGDDAAIVAPFVKPTHSLCLTVIDSGTRATASYDSGGKMTAPRVKASSIAGRWPNCWNGPASASGCARRPDPGGTPFRYTS